MPINPPQATLITDSGSRGGGAGGEPPSVRVRDGVLSGRRDYRVNTHDELAALEALGVPREGDAWDASRPDLRCVEIGPTRYIGGRDGSDGTGGWTIVPAVYTTPSGRGRLPVPTANLAFTEIDPGTRTETVYFPIPDPGLVGPPDPHPINNGLGAPRVVPTLRLLVHRFIPAASFTAATLRGFLPLGGRVNANAVTLPNLYTVGGALTFERGELLYLHATARPSGTLVELVHTLEAGLDFLFRWVPEDESGRAIPGVVVASQIQPEINFPPL